MATKKLFISDTYAKPKPSFSQHIPKSVFSEWNVFEAYNLPVNALTAVCQVSGHEINSSNFLVRMKRMSYVLKKLPRLAAIDRRKLIKRLNVLGQAEAKGLRIPRLMKAKTGTFLVEADGFDWFLMEFIEGRHSVKNKADLWEQGLQIGRAFKKLKRVENLGALKRRYFVAFERRTFEQLSKKIQRMKSVPNDVLYKQFKKHWDMIEKNYNETYAAWRRGPKLETQTVHIDLHPHNLIVNDKGKLFLLDFEALMLGYPDVCLGFSSFKVLRNYFSGLPQKPSPQRIRKMTEDFCEAVSKEFRVPKVPVRRFALGARLEIVKRILYIAWDDRENKSRKWAKQLVNHLRALQEIEVMFGHDG